MQLAQSSKASARGASLGPRPEKFGDQVTCDHLLAQDVDDVGMDDESCALVLLDRGTDYIDAIPQPERTAACCYMALLEFAGPYDYINELYSDGAPELVKAAKDAKWIHSTSAPERPQKNGVAERAVRSVKAGGRTVLLKAGLPAKFWPKAIRHWCFSRNVRKEPPNRGGSPLAYTNSFTLRHKGNAFKGQRMLFGALIGFRQTKSR